MAKTEEKKLERVYNVPLRKDWLRTPKYKRSKKAVKALREFLTRHMKPGVDERGRVKLKIGRMANLDIWKHGIKNPPHHIKVKAVKSADGTVKAELVGFEYQEEKKSVKKEKKSRTEELKEKFIGKAPVKKEEPKRETKETKLEKTVEETQPKKEEPKKEEEPKNEAQGLSQ
ncbi:MAG: 60S ribosomal protein L31 [Nanoarchaeota archaeon]|nr:60S ribosomal protein L31 [Nanoarchaeota archaeon]